MSIRKSVRFEVLARDGFKCRYCGWYPPFVALEVDHVQSRVDGGSDGLDNLVTACVDCNRGKSATSMEVIPPSLPSIARSAMDAVDSCLFRMSVIDWIKLFSEMESINKVLNDPKFDDSTQAAKQWQS